MNYRLRRWHAALAICAIAGGCSGVTSAMGSSWHEKFHWKAEDYFSDPQAVALCHAIEQNDLKEMDRLIAAGANVNAKGKGNMTPLLWAFPDNKLDRFKLLLEHDADPNVIVESDFGTHGVISTGEAVTHMACDTTFPGYFEAVFAHGGDPNLITSGKAQFADSPLLRVIKSAGSNHREKVDTLIKIGADLNYRNNIGATPAMEAVSWGGQYDIALMLLNAGADPGIYQWNELQKLTHVIARTEFYDLGMATAKQKADHAKVVEWLDAHGESVQEAKADLDRWAKWDNASGESKVKMDAEIAARKAREGEKKEKAAQNPQEK